MADIRNAKLIDLDLLKEYHGLLTTSMGADATSALHSLAHDTTAHTIKFYKEEAAKVTSTTTPAFTVDIADIYNNVGDTTTVSINGVTTTVVASAIQALDKEIGSLTGLTVNGVAATSVIDAIKALDTKVAGATAMTVKKADGTVTTAVTEAINRLDAEVGTFANLAVETTKGTTASDVIAALNALDTEMGNLYDLQVEVSAGTTASNVVSALNVLNTKVGEGSTASKVIMTSTAGTTADNFFKSYSIFQGTTAASDLVGEIQIPRDYLVKSATVKTATKDDDPVVGIKTGDKYLDFVVNSKDGGGTESHIYIPIKDMGNVYTVEKTASEIQLAISASNEFSAKYVAGSIDTTAVKDNAITTGKMATASVTKDILATGSVTSAALANNACVGTTTAPATTADYTTISVAAFDSNINSALNKAYSALQNTDVVLATTADIAGIFTV